MTSHTAYLQEHCHNSMQSNQKEIVRSRKFCVKLMVAFSLQKLISKNVMCRFDVRKLGLDKFERELKRYTFIQLFQDCIQLLSAFNCGLIEILVPTYYLGKSIIVEKCHRIRSVKVLHHRVIIVKMFLCLVRVQRHEIRRSKLFETKSFSLLSILRLVYKRKQYFTQKTLPCS